MIGNHTSESALFPIDPMSPPEDARRLRVATEPQELPPVGCEPHVATPRLMVDERFEVLECIGEGGIATVWSAWDRKTSAEVALKLLNPNLLSDEPSDFAERFSREARAARAIQHPCVVKILEFGVHGPLEVPYIAMEKLSGHDLKHELTHRGPIPPERAWPLFLDTLTALGQGHARGIIHKDLKPDNLLLVHRDGREHLVVVDFGVACIHASSRLTARGQVSGTPRYMAPEYITSQTVTPAVDVYQMALILVETLSGRPVVDARDIFLAITQHTSGDLPIPPAFRDSPLGPILERALHIDPNERYPDAFAFRDALLTLDPSNLFPEDDELVATGVIRTHTINRALEAAEALLAEREELEADNTLPPTPASIRRSAIAPSPAEPTQHDVSHDSLQHTTSDISPTTELPLQSPHLPRIIIALTTVLTLIFLAIILQTW